MKRLFLSLLIAAGLMSMVTGANAAEFRAPVDQNESVIISETETPKNLYTSSSSVTVNAPVAGDLTAAGGTVMVTGDVANSLFAAGGTVSVRSKIGQNARIVGGEVTFSGTVGEDLLIAGGTVLIGSDAVINGDLLIAGGMVTIDGVVKGAVRIGGGAVVINNSTGAVRAYAGTLQLGPKAVINGDLIYTADASATLDSSAKVTGTTTFTQAETRSAFKQLFTVSSLVSMLGLILLILLLIRLRPQFSQSIYDKAIASPMNLIGYGALGTFIAPLVLLALAFTVVGFPIAGVFFLIWLTVVVLAMVYAQLILGMWIVQKLTKASAAKLDWQAVVVGVLASGILNLVPYIGWLINLLVFLLALGVLLSTLTRRETATVQTV